MRTYGSISLRTWTSASLAAVFACGSAVAFAENVTVVNKTSHPVPTTVQNTVPVTGAVNANITNSSLPVSGNVTVTNTVPVAGTVNATISGTPTVNIGTMPTVTATVQDPAKTFFQAKVTLNDTGVLNAIGTLLYVPSGQRGVVESASMNCSFPTGVSPAQAFLYSWHATGSNSAEVFPLYILLQKQGSFNGHDYYIGSFSGRFYVDWNSIGIGQLAVDVYGDTSAAWQCDVAASGYYVTL